MDFPVPFDALTRYRAFLVPLWHAMHSQWQEETKPSSVSLYMCRYSCLFLHVVLKHEHDLDAKIVIGRPVQEKNGTADGVVGFCDTGGKWHDHAWLEIGNVILDLTADQFGADDIICTDHRDKRYNASPDQSGFCAELDKLRPRVEQWLEAYYATA